MIAPRAIELGLSILCTETKASIKSIYLAYKPVQCSVIIDELLSSAP